MNPIEKEADEETNYRQVMAIEHLKYQFRWWDIISDENHLFIVRWVLTDWEFYHFSVNLRYLPRLFIA